MIDNKTVYQKIANLILTRKQDIVDLINSFGITANTTDSDEVIAGKLSAILSLKPEAQQQLAIMLTSQPAYASGAETAGATSSSGGGGVLNVIGSVANMGASIANAFSTAKSSKATETASTNALTTELLRQKSGNDHTAVYIIAGVVIVVFAGAMLVWFLKAKK